MKTSPFTVATLFLSFTAALAQEKEIQTAPRRLTYEEVLARWDKSRYYGDPRNLRQFSSDLVSALKTGQVTDDCSEGLRDGPWIRFYARCEQVLGDTTVLVLVTVLIVILSLSHRLLFPPFQRVLARMGQKHKANTISDVSEGNDDPRLRGVGGWLLILCIWLTILGPLLSFAKLSESAGTDFQWLCGIVLLSFSLMTGYFALDRTPKRLASCHFVFLVHRRFGMALPFLL